VATKTDAIILTIADWNIQMSDINGDVKIEITRADKSPVLDIEEDIGDENTLAYRLTSDAIEAAYRKDGPANVKHQSNAIILCNVRVDFVHDADSHLALFCRSLTNNAPEHIALTNGTQYSPSCDIQITA
jgi:hypothetical protein